VTGRKESPEPPGGRSAPSRPAYRWPTLGRAASTTTWKGDVLAWSNAEEKVVFTAKLGDGHADLACDEKNDRFLIGDASSTGTPHLRALVRVRGAE
jgi:hypothetical protein